MRDTPEFDVLSSIVPGPTPEYSNREEKAIRERKKKTQNGAAE